MHIATPDRLARLAILAALTGLAGCQIPFSTSSASPQPSPGAVAACDKRADQEFTAQNREAIYQADRYDTSLRDAPDSSSGLRGSTAGLSDQYARSQDVSHCLNGEATPLSPVPDRSGAAP
jgi:hypothetical protein